MSASCTTLARGPPQLCGLSLRSRLRGLQSPVSGCRSWRTGRDRGKWKEEGGSRGEEGEEEEVIGALTYAATDVG
eukprot:746991-Hanusia_phi.AAC.5